MVELIGHDGVAEELLARGERPGQAGGEGCRPGVDGAAEEARERLPGVGPLAQGVKRLPYGVDVGRQPVGAELAQQVFLAGKAAVQSADAHASPLRDGRNGGAQRGASLIMCGMKLPEGGCSEKTGKKF